MLNFSNDFYKTIKKYKYKNFLLIKNKIMGIINKKRGEFFMAIYAKEWKKN